MEDKEIDGGEVPTTVVASGNGIEIGFEGYGTAAGPDDPVILVEHVRGHIKVLVWADRRSKDPTHVIDLEGAKAA